MYYYYYYFTFISEINFLIMCFYYQAMRRAITRSTVAVSNNDTKSSLYPVVLLQVLLLILFYHGLHQIVVKCYVQLSFVTFNFKCYVTLHYVTLCCYVTTDLTKIKQNLKMVNFYLKMEKAKNDSKERTFFIDVFQTGASLFAFQSHNSCSYKS